MDTSSDPLGLVGSTIAGRYVVEAFVGEGGFSVVYRARHVLWNRPVAIKAFRGVELGDDEARDSLLGAFVQEGAILAELSERSTAVVQARDTATLVTPAGEWVPYLVLEWLPGDTLEAVLWHERRRGFAPRSLADATALVDPVARALALAHDLGICHRDLKPGNLVVVGDARRGGAVVKLLDFGAAAFFSDAARPPRERVRALRDPRETWSFTPSYGAPEQFSPAYGVTGPWTDVFALALMLVELLSGREPLGFGPSLEEFAAVATDPHRRPTPRSAGVDVPDAIEAVFERALTVFPAERWQTVGLFWRALTEAMEGATAPTGSAAPEIQAPAKVIVSDAPIPARAPEPLVGPSVQAKPLAPPVVETTVLIRARRAPRARRGRAGSRVRRPRTRSVMARAAAAAVTVLVAVALAASAASDGAVLRHPDVVDAAVVARSP